MDLRSFRAWQMGLVALLAIALLLLSPPVTNSVWAQQCQAAPGGPPCERAGGPSSLGDPAGVDLTVGNPFHPLSGNKYQEEVDAAPEPGVLGLEIRRHYNAMYAAAAGTPPGRGWQLSYDTRLYRIGRSVQIVQADGRRVMFYLDQTAATPGRQLCHGDTANQGRLWIEPGDAGYVWQWPSGRTLVFNAWGWLVEIRSLDPVSQTTDPSDLAPVRLRRDAEGRLVQVTDPAGRSMRLYHDADGHLLRIEHPRGIWHYRISSAGQILAVSAPNGAVRRYEYSDSSSSSRLTAIFQQDAPSEPRHLIGRWHYDPEGRVTAYRAADGRSLAMQYGKGPDPDGITENELTSEAGERTRYRFRTIGGRLRPVSIEGPGCRQCGPANVAFFYDAAGALQEVTPLAGSPSAAQRGRPASPGVTPRLRYQRDAQGRIVRIERVERVEAIEPAERVRRTAHATRTGRMAGSDRPVGVGRADGEAGRAGTATVLIRRFEYPDEQSQLPSVIASLSVETGREYRLDIRYGKESHLRDHPIEITESGYSDGKAVSRTVGFGYDDQGRLVSLDGPLPGTADTYTVEHRASGNGQAAYRLIYPLGRPVPPSGGMASDEALVGDVTSGGAVASGDVKHSGASAALFERLRTLPGFTVTRADFRHEAGNGARGRHLADDFGRTIRIESADAGTESFEYDAADRIVRQTDSTGASVDLRYDVAGRRLERIVRTPAGFEESTRYHYSGRHLVRVEHPVADEFLRYDGLDRLVDRTIEIHVGDRPQRLVTGFTYRGDDRRPIVRRLPDGSRLRYQQRDAGSPVAITWQPDRWSEPRLLFRARPTPGTAPGSDALVRRARPSPGERGGPSSGAAPVRTSAATAEPGGATGDDWVYGNGVRRSVRRDEAMRPIEINHQLAQPAGAGGAVSLQTSETTVAGRRLHYDGRGRIDRIVSWPAAPSPTSTLTPASTPAPTPTQAFSARASAAPVTKDVTAYAYDSAGRLIIAQGPEGPWWYGYDANGNLQAARQPADLSSTASGGFEQRHAYGPASNRLREVSHDAVGRPATWRGFDLVWHPGGQLAQIEAGGKVVARYFYSHRGERIAKQVGDDWTWYLHEGGRLVAEWNNRSERLNWYLQWQGLPVAILAGARPRDEVAGSSGSGDGQGAPAPWRDADEESSGHVLGRLFRRALGQVFGRESSVTYLHHDHIGSPIAATNDAGRVVWQGRFSPYGEWLPDRARAGPTDAADIRLRLPGQYHDPESGLHYNLHRYYDPQMGRYLTPDPMGLRAGPNSYLYAAGNPLSYSDPTGLLLFAFDGTWNAPDDQSNVFNFNRLYSRQSEESTSSTRDYWNYVPGIGVRADGSRSRLEGAIAGDWRASVDLQLERFFRATEGLQPGEQLFIDVVGFSRGGTQALVFGQEIARALREGRVPNGDQITLRFMGLFDAVSTSMFVGWSPAAIRCATRIAAEWQHVTHLVSANERRTQFGADLLPVSASAPGSTRREIALIGGHADIGGGYVGEREPNSRRGDLSDIALWVMLEQARQAGVELQPLPESMRDVSRPYLHDESGERQLPDTERIVTRDGRTVYLDQAGIDGITREESARFVGPPPAVADPGRPDVEWVPSNVYGTVDLSRYCGWMVTRGLLSACPP